MAQLLHQLLRVGPSIAAQSGTASVQRASSVDGKLEPVATETVNPAVAAALARAAASKTAMPAAGSKRSTAAFAPPPST